MMLNCGKYIKPLEVENLNFMWNLRQHNAYEQILDLETRMYRLSVSYHKKHYYNWKIKLDNVLAIDPDCSESCKQKMFLRVNHSNLVFYRWLEKKRKLFLYTQEKLTLQIATNLRIIDEYFEESMKIVYPRVPHHLMLDRKTLLTGKPPKTIHYFKGRAIKGRKETMMDVNKQDYDAFKKEYEATKKKIEQLEMLIASLKNIKLH